MQIQGLKLTKTLILRRANKLFFRKINTCGGETREKGNDLFCSHPKNKFFIYVDNGLLYIVQLLFTETASQVPNCLD